MIDHIKLRVADAGVSKAFYDQALGPLDYRVIMEPLPGVIGMGGTMPDFWLSHDGTTRTAHVAFRAEDRAAVDAFYEAAMAAAGVDDGPAGPRPQYHPATTEPVVLDPDANNVEAVCHAVPEPGAAS